MIEEGWTEEHLSGAVSVYCLPLDIIMFQFLCSFSLHAWT